LLEDGDVAPGDGEVVIRGEEGDQAKCKATDGLGETEPVDANPAETEARPGRRCCR
jgi:hypothetical protein